MANPNDRSDRTGRDPDRTGQRCPPALLFVGIGLLLALIIVAHLLGGFRGPH